MNYHSHKVFLRALPELSRKIAVLVLLSISLFSFVISHADELVTKKLGVHHHIMISGFEFVPKRLKVSIGDTVTWENKDIFPHNIATDSGQKALSEDLTNNQIFTFVVKDSLSYICGLHPSMKGELIVDY